MDSDVTVIAAEPDTCRYIYNLVCRLEQTSFDYEEFKKNYAANLKNPDIQYLIITCNGERCGFISLHCQILLHHNAKIAEIQEFIIEEQYRSRGIGKKVISEIKKKCMLEKIDQLEVCTNKKRTATQAFYAANNFIESHLKYTMRLCTLAVSIFFIFGFCLHGAAGPGSYIGNYYTRVK